MRLFLLLFFICPLCRAEESVINDPNQKLQQWDLGNNHVLDLIYNQYTWHINILNNADAEKPKLIYRESYLRNSSKPFSSSVEPGMHQLYIEKYSFVESSLMGPVQRFNITTPGDYLIISFGIDGPKKVYRYMDSELIKFYKDLTAGADEK